MAKKAACPQCGARNDLDARRCRVCANLLDASIPEEPYKPKGLPESVQRQIEAEMGVRPQDQTFIPGEEAGFSPAPPPSVGAPAAEGAFGPPGPGAPPPPPAAPLPAGDEIVIDVAPRYAQEAPPPPAAEAEAEHFDPDALFVDMGRQATLPPPPPPPPPPDELRLPPPPAKGPDPLWEVSRQLGPDATSAEIEAATREALREERLKRRPGFLDRVFQGDADEGQDQQQQQ